MFGQCRHTMRTALAAVLLGMLALTSGCFSGDVNVVINDDGSADLKTTLVSVPMLAEVVEQSKTTALARNPEAQITPVTKENMSGYEISEHYATIEKLSENDFFTAHDGKNTGVTVNKSLFYTDYNFDLLFSGSENGGGAGAFASNITFTYQMNLPVVPASSNADRTENDGKTLTWNLGMWNKAAIAAAVIAVLVLIGAAVFFIMRRRKRTEEEPQAAHESSSAPST